MMIYPDDGDGGWGDAWGDDTSNIIYGGAGPQTDLSTLMLFMWMWLLVSTRNST
jgi:hypothetical protein